MKYIDNNGKFNHAKWQRDQILNEGPYNDPALKALRLKAKGELMPELSKWWEYEPEDVMRFVYWGKGQMAPTNQAVLEKEWANIVKQLHVKYPIPADAEGHLDMATIGEAAGTKSFVPGDMWSEDFDYVGMLKAGTQATYEMGLDALQELYASFEDVNYHSENKFLGYAISEMEDPGQDANQAQENIERDLEDFREACLATLKDMKVKWKPSTKTGRNLAMSTQGRANLRNKLAKQNIPGYDKHLEPKVKGRR